MLQVESKTHCVKAGLPRMGLPWICHSRTSATNHRGSLLPYSVPSSLLSLPCSIPLSLPSSIHHCSYKHKHALLSLSLSLSLSLLVLQSCLFECLQKTKLIADSRSCHYTRCGRTDKGVSALGQVLPASLTLIMCLLVLFLIRQFRSFHWRFAPTSWRGKG